MIKIEAATRLQVTAQSKGTAWGEGYQNGIGDNSNPCDYIEGTVDHGRWQEGRNRGLEDKKVMP